MNYPQSSGSSSDSSSSSVPHGGGRVRSQSGHECVVEKSPKGRFHRFNRKLGSGSYKTVYLAFDNDTGREVAWNVISFAHLSRHERKRIDDEIKIAKSLDHDRILSFINAWINKKKEEVVFITERVNGGSLRQYINRLDGPLKVKVIRMWCKQILEGINYLHNQLKVPVIHRDLKCDNIFINGSDGKVLIGDLGLSTALQHASVATSIVGTPEFMAPELYEESYGPSVDIYAFGMCLLEMVTRRFPYAECATPGQIYKKVINGEMPDSLERIQNKELKRIIEQCIEKDPAMRPTAAELLTMSCWDQKDDGDELATLEPLPSSKDDDGEGVNDESPNKEKGHRPRKGRGLSNVPDRAVGVDTVASAQPGVAATVATPNGDRSATVTPRGSGDGIGRSGMPTVIHRTEARIEEDVDVQQQQQVGSGERRSLQLVAPPGVVTDSESVKSTPADVGQQRLRTSSESSDGGIASSERTISAPVAAEPDAGARAGGGIDLTSDSSEAPQLISATTHIDAANSATLTGGEAIIRRDVARRPPNSRVMAAVVARDGTVQLPPEIEAFCRKELGSDRVTNVVLLIETETDKFQRINFEYSLDEDTCDSIAEELLENNLVWREVNRDRLVQKIRQAVFMRVKQIALEEGIPLSPPVAAAIASSITSTTTTTTAAKQLGVNSVSPPVPRIAEDQALKVSESPMSQPRTPPGDIATVSGEAVAAATEGDGDEGRRAQAREVVTANPVTVESDVVKRSGPVAQPPAINPQTYAAVAAIVPIGTPTTTASAPFATNLRAAAVAKQNGPSHPVVAETPLGPADEVADARAAAPPQASPTTPANGVGVPAVSSCGKPPPAPPPRPTSHALALLDTSGGRLSYSPPSGHGEPSSGTGKLLKKMSMSKYVPLTPETTAHLTNDSVSGVGLEQVVPHFYKDVLNAEYGDSGQSGADSTSGRAASTISSEVPIFPEIPPPLNDGHAPTEEDVAWVQIALAAVVPSVRPTAFPKIGVMCPATVEVIKGFQGYHSLPVDGNMDDRTWQVLVDALETRRQKIEEREAKRAEAKLKAKMVSL
ncbi:hypothetical protein Pmar_PMAR005296 [Perkinsus marinus ATCC 50983]|uniref:Protein kinase domain-containing protein n=1 Tax=Perkinsus marinus (strain ATCC 50983 / TXsc) TaxID=423536 RepID=C5KB59_PERM5|nr:hypothetical protein Pmar_PMAR005296 [Perkinsus marinus ATCC 50983]EER18385.1 hypothetical protein Pmar_PMAR005296 [Perkinsus marinus ATCC 50983]|eukprot:XP_002786589.1 hypothetical protein Pmar_PMAR005296 [Perkinsus marinus ATCC 50983]